jgi:hypothetical protein
VSCDGGIAVVVFAKNTMFPMRDGVKLATDIYRPAAALQHNFSRFYPPLSGRAADYSGWRQVLR